MIGPDRLAAFVIVVAALIAVPGPVGVGNPKGFLLFTAVLPQFVSPTAGSVTAQLLLLGPICVAT
jgi:threonine/homoserine/homoserine lactone efflux protein